MTTNEQSGGKEQGATSDWGPLAKEVSLKFAIPPGKDELFESLNEDISLANEPFAEIGVAFRTNVQGLISTVSIPFTLANKSAHDRHWQRIHGAERIRALIPPGLPNETDEELESRRERESLNSARSKMLSFLQSQEGHHAIISDTLGFLQVSGMDEAVAAAANELILQGVVLCWSAFEVFARDCFIAHLNEKPARTLALLEDVVTKRRFELSKVSLETLANHDFNLSERMGDLLAQQHDLSDVYSVKSVYQALFSDDKKLFDSLNDSDLRLLSLRRNLIVHQCGIIDQKYAISSQCGQRVGERLKLSPQILEAHIGTIVRTTAHILGAVSAGT